MTFAECRSKLLSRLDSAYAELFKVVSDPKWANERYKGYTEPQEKMSDVMKIIAGLNTIEQGVAE